MCNFPWIHHPRVQGSCVYVKVYKRQDFFPYWCSDGVRKTSLQLICFFLWFPFLKFQCIICFLGILVMRLLHFMFCPPSVWKNKEVVHGISQNALEKFQVILSHVGSILCPSFPTNSYLISCCVFAVVSSNHILWCIMHVVLKLESLIQLLLHNAF